jgi:signal transduction histidine kinase
LFRAVGVIQQTTTMHFLRLADERVADREERLRAFNRAVSHEVKNRIGTALGASETLLDVPGLPAEEQRKFFTMISRSLRSMNTTVENLLALSRTDNDARQHRHVRLPAAAHEAKRQVREAAEAAGVDIRIAKDIANLEVNAAAVELCLTNYLTNSIKYADPAKSERFAEVTASPQETAEHGREVIVRVTDNGLGVPAEKRDQLFQRFFRAHETVTDQEGTGLGLSIVRETAQSVGGRAWAEFPDEGSVFAFSLPCRRDESTEPHHT